MSPRLLALGSSTASPVLLPVRSSALLSNLLSTLLPALLSTFMAAAAAQTPPDTPRSDNARALERCEAAVVETLQRLRGKQAQQVQFTPAQRALSAGDDAEINVKGGGRYRGASGAGTPFSFNCTFNPKSGSAPGVVLRESTSARSEADWQPDLSRISPQACESATAQLLTEKHPRVARIALEPDTRKLQPGPDDHIMLLGQGAVQRAPGMNSVPFSYSCEFDGRTGRLVQVKTSV